MSKSPFTNIQKGNAVYYTPQFPDVITEDQLKEMGIDLGIDFEELLGHDCEAEVLQVHVRDALDHVIE